MTEVFKTLNGLSPDLVSELFQKMRHSTAFVSQIILDYQQHCTITMEFMESLLELLYSGINYLHLFII